MQFVNLLTEMFVWCFQGINKGCRYKHGVWQTVWSYRPKWYRKNDSAPNIGQVSWFLGDYFVICFVFIFGQFGFLKFLMCNNFLTVSY